MRLRRRLGNQEAYNEFEEVSCFLVLPVYSLMSPSRIQLLRDKQKTGKIKMFI